MSGAHTLPSLGHSGPGSDVCVLGGGAFTPTPGFLSGPIWRPSCARGEEAQGSGWPTASQLPPTWVSWWGWRLCMKTPSSHGFSCDIRLQSTTDTGDEELGGRPS